MDKTQFPALLDRIYELEGLVHLALDRDDNPGGLERLIKDKALQIMGDITGDPAGADGHSKEYMPLEEGDEDEGEGDDGLTPEILAAIEPYVNPAQEEGAEVPRHTLNDRTPQQPSLNDRAGCAKSVNEANTRGRLVFSLNDRFRFRRSLFGDDQQAFGRSLSQVAAMDSYEEAEDYFLGELKWHPDDAEAKAFLEIIKGYFGA